jgi:hypothetical protein
MTIKDGEYGWVKLDYQTSHYTWKLVRGPTDPTNHGMLSKWKDFWTVSIIGELVATLPNSMSKEDAMNTAKMLLLSLKD